MRPILRRGPEPEPYDVGLGENTPINVLGNYLGIAVDRFRDFAAVPLIRAGAIEADSCIDLSLTNCTAYGNTTQASGAVLYSSYQVTVTMTNNNFWGNGSPWIDAPEPDNLLQLTYNNLDTQQTGTGNMSEDPLFILPDDPDFANVDLGLGTGSPCIDAGDNAAVTSSTDLAGNPRIVDGDDSGTDEVDMGAYEAQGG